MFVIYNFLLFSLPFVYKINETNALSKFIIF